MPGVRLLSMCSIIDAIDLFWFAFDAFGNCFMLDNTNLNCLRQYDDAYRAMTDCLVAGKL